MPLTSPLPDIAETNINNDMYPLQWVGMEGIAIPLNLTLSTDKLQTVTAIANVYVGLDDTSKKGIHMSRLHALLNEFSRSNGDKKALKRLLTNMVSSQGGISQSAKIELSFDVLLPKKALLSDETGYQSYQARLSAQLCAGDYDYGLHLTIPYSSTCPCSAALSRQLLANAIDKTFDESSIDKSTLLAWVQDNSVATPHSQRSYAYLELTLGNHDYPPLDSLIVSVETAIGTPVQTMVKRRDEQEFASLNAANLMFCEDAARHIKALLEKSAWVADYWFKVEHQESLHAHNAVVIDRKRPYQ